MFEIRLNVCIIYIVLDCWEECHETCKGLVVGMFAAYSEPTSALKQQQIANYNN